MSDAAADDFSFDPPPRRRSPLGTGLRLLAGVTVLLAAGAGSALVMVQPGEALVLTRFGDPVRVLTEPGPAWKIPAPVETSVAVDLRLRTTSSGLQDVGTKDGLRVLVQAYAAWQVDPAPAHVRQFLRAARNDPQQFTDSLRSFMGSALQVTASEFLLTDLVNSDPAKCRLPAFEQALQANLADTMLAMYGVRIVQVGTERLSLPAETLAATVARMRAERETVAAERTAEGMREAAAIRSDAERDARITAADALQQTAEIDAASRRQAGQIQARAYDIDPGLYSLVRSLDTLGRTVGPRTRLVLRADAAPFSVLVGGPDAAAAPAGQAAPPGAQGAQAPR
jgi:membrane protease subunit HflC